MCALSSAHTHNNAILTFSSLSGFALMCSIYIFIYLLAFRRCFTASGLQGRNTFNFRKFQRDREAGQNHPTCNVPIYLPLVVYFIIFSLVVIVSGSRPCILRYGSRSPEAANSPFTSCGLLSPPPPKSYPNSSIILR